MIYISYTSEYVLSSLVKIPLSILFSFIIGYERELHSHPGGVMTHILVGLGSCLFTMCSVHISDNYPSVNSDPARICAQIVSGMGFLGSATIYKSNNYLKGINTAANLWISAAVSMAIGADLWEFAFLTSVSTIIILFINNRYKIVKYIKNRKLNKKKYRRRSKSISNDKSILNEIKIIHPCKTEECPICMPYCSADDLNINDSSETELESGGEKNIRKDAVLDIEELHEESEYYEESNSGDESNSEEIKCNHHHFDNENIELKETEFNLQLGNRSRKRSGNRSRNNSSGGCIKRRKLQNEIIDSNC